MPFALIIVGIIMLVASVRGKQDELFQLIQKDFTGDNNFIYWVFAMLVIGALGYIPKLQPISTAFLVLVVLVLFLKRGDSRNIGGGFFAQLTEGLASTSNTSPTTALQFPQYKPADLTLPNILNFPMIVN